MFVKKGMCLFFVITVLFSVFLFSGCIGEPGPGNETGNSPENNVIRGASFYIDNFTVEKAADENVVKTLADIIHRFDVIGLQGINDPDAEAMRILMEAVNNGTDANGTPYKYQYNLSEPVGRLPDSREQYAFIYNRNVLYPSSTPRIYQDAAGADIFNKDPYLVAFRAYEGQGQVLFVLLTTDENRTQEEIDALPQLIEDIKSRYIGHENITIVGNLHSDAPYYDKAAASPLKSDDFVWMIPDEMATTTDGRTYDRIIATANLKDFYAGKAGVFNFSAEYGLDQTQTEAISTHYPVYVEYWLYPPNNL